MVTRANVPHSSFPPTMFVNGQCFRHICRDGHLLGENREAWQSTVHVLLCPPLSPPGFYSCTIIHNSPTQCHIISHNITICHIILHNITQCHKRLATLFWCYGVLLWCAPATGSMLCSAGPIQWHRPIHVMTPAHCSTRLIYPDGAVPSNWHPTHPAT